MDNAAHTLDTVVVGAGVAGLAAALFLARAGCAVRVYDGGPPRITAVSTVREYLGFDGWTPAALLAQARGEVSRYGGDIRAGQVLSIQALDGGLFAVYTAEGSVTTRSVVLATGLVDVLPAVEGIPAVWGDALRVCPCFDGHEVRGQRFVVFGLPERMAHMAAWVSLWSPQVTVVSPQPFNATEREKLQLLGVQMLQDEVAGLVHRDQRLVAVSTAGGRQIDCDAAWVALGFKAASGLAATLCDVDAQGLALVDANGQTSRPGVFAVGNASAAGVWAHLAQAAASGTQAGPLVSSYLLEQRLQARRLAAAAG